MALLMDETCRPSGRGYEVRFLEVFSFEQERLAGDLGKRIGEAVAEIQPSLVTPFSEIVKRLACDMRLLDCKRLDNDACPAEKHIALAGDFRPGLTLDDYGELQKAPDANETALRTMDEPDVAVGFRFPEQNRHQRGRVQDHLGRPCSSYRSLAWSKYGRLT